MALQPPIRNDGGQHLIIGAGGKLTVEEGAEVEGLSTGGDTEPADGSVTEAKLDKALQDKLNDLEKRLTALESPSSDS